MVEIHNSDGFVYKIGLGCFKKLLKENQFSQLSAKVFNKYLNTLKKYNEGLKMWESCETLPELIEAYEKKPKTWIFVMWSCYGWKTDEFKEITPEMFNKERNYMLNEFYPYRIKSVQAEMQKKFPKMNIKF